VSHRIALAIMTLGLAGSLEAQVCRPSPSSNEAKTLALLSVPVAFGAAAAPVTNPGFEVGLEGTYLPKIDPATATATVCRPGKGPEHTDFLFALPRPRISVSLPGGLALQASWIPPIRVAGVKANLFGFSLAKVLARRDGLAAAIRAHAAVGSIRAPITCDQTALADPVSECFRGTLSDDKYSPNVYGADVSVGLARGAFRPYVGGGYNRLQPRFRVNFRNQFGSVDSTRVEVNLNRAVVFGGASWQFHDRFTVTGEAYAAPADAITARLVLRAAVGP
jgi:hypothetical protein